MATYKHLTDLLKICSVLPVLAIMPAMAEEPDVNNDNLAQSGQVYRDTIAGQRADNVTRGGAVTIDVDVSGVSVADGTSFIGNKHLAATGGGAIKALNGFTIGNNVTFDGNTADNNGWAGALYIRLADKANLSENTTVKIGENSVFKNNSGLFGGAIGLEYGTLEIANGAQFIGNHASGTEDTFGGGAIIVWQDQKDRPELHSTLKLNGATFSQNKAANVGGAIAIFDTGAETTINNSNFSNNIAGGDGGAIYNEKDAELIINGGTFTNNHSGGYGGAIGSKGHLNISGTTFANNDGFVGGALYSGYNDSGIGKGAATISGATFNNNSGLYGAGAIANYGDMEINISQTIFNGNKVTSEIVNDGYDNHNLKTSVDGGGAIFAGSASKTTVEKAIFINNSSTVTGGAISTRADWYSSETNKPIDSKENAPEDYDTSTDYLNPNTKAELTLKNVEFTNNTAGTYGGAIYNTFVNTSISDAIFSGNTAARNGGAIYNEAVAKMEFAGNNVFAGNTAAGVANDIHNDGVIDIASGTTTLGGGITGDGTLTIADGATLNIGTTTVKQSEVTLDGTLTAQILNQGSYGRVETGNITVGDNGLLNLMFGSVGTYNFGVTVPEDKIVYNNAIYDATFGETGEITVATKSVEEIAQGTNLSMGAANAVSIMANTKDDVLNTISLMAQQDLVAGKTGNAEKELAKLNPDDKPVAQSVASSVQNQVMSLAAGRMSGASVGRSGGDLTSADYGLWVQGLYNHSKYNGKFSGDTWGISVGADTLIDGKYTLGIGYAYNDTDVDSNSRDTGIESNSLFLYGQYKPNEWYVNAALNYTMANYDESADPYGFKRKTEYDVDSFGGQIMTGYDFASGFTPEVGMRYLHISQDAYQSWLGEVDALDTDYLTGVAGVKYAFEIESASELKFRPELRAAATYDFMSDAAVATVTAPGNVAYVIDADRLSRFGGEFGIGLTAQYRGLDVSLNYELDLHEDYTSQTGMLKFRYDF